VVVAGGPAMVQGAPVQTVVAQPVAVDMVPQEIARLSSAFSGTRREAAGILGRMHDSRAIPALVERLKNDSDKSVRITAAHALADIGDPGAAVYLERSSIYDKKPEVRSASSVAFARLTQPLPAPTQVPAEAHVVASRSNISLSPPSGASVPAPPPPTPGIGERR
jgi:HEAT repeat protein